MKTGLRTGVVNTRFSCDDIKDTVVAVRATYSFDRSQPFDDYRCTALFKVSHLIKYGIDSIPMRKDAKNKLVRDCRLMNTKNILNEKLEVLERLFTDASHSNAEFVHILVERRIFHDGKQELRLLLPPKQTHLGYCSNRSSLTKKGLAFLEGKEHLSLRRKMLLKLHEIASRFPQIALILNLPVVTQTRNAA